MDEVEGQMASETEGGIAEDNVFFREIGGRPGQVVSTDNAGCTGLNIEAEGAGGQHLEEGSVAGGGFDEGILREVDVDLLLKGVPALFGNRGGREELVLGGGAECGIVDFLANNFGEVEDVLIWNVL